MNNLAEFKDDFIALFTEWKLRYDENPSGFQSHGDFLTNPPKSYGEGAARYFLELWTELSEVTK